MGLDILATQDTPIHRLDPRAKVLTALTFVVTVVSFRGNYDVAAPYPAGRLSYSSGCAGQLARHAICSASCLSLRLSRSSSVFSIPSWIERFLMQIGPIQFSGGWVSYASILLRFCSHALRSAYSDLDHGVRFRLSGPDAARSPSCTYGSVHAPVSLHFCSGRRGFAYGEGLVASCSAGAGKCRRASLAH